MINPKYIAFEGIDGSGKTTQISLLCQKLREYNYTAIRLFEPTHGKFGSMIRGHMVRGDDLSVEKQRELFTLDRREHVEQKIKPLLKFVGENDSFLIIQDRSYLSASAYQADGEEEMLSVLKEQQTFAPKPDIIFLLDVPVPTAIKRLEEAGKGKAVFENIETLKKVRDRYLFLAENSGENVKVLDASQPAENVSNKILESLDLTHPGP